MYKPRGIFEVSGNEYDEQKVGKAGKGRSRLATRGK